MSKRLGKLPKDPKMSVTAEARELLWQAVPPRSHDTKRSWFAQAARLLGWRERRVRAIFHCEARVITADEWRTLNQRIDALKAAERRHEREADELRETLRMAREGMPMARRAIEPVGDETTTASDAGSAARREA